MTYECAFCGEENEVLVDPGGGRRQTFTEDCAVCCRPMDVFVRCRPGELLSISISAA